MAISAVYFDSDPNISVTISYNDVNLRFTYIEWEILDNQSYQVTIWRKNIDPITPVYQEIYTGPDSGSVAMPGNMRLVETVDEIDSHEYLAWPEGLTAEVTIV